MPPLPPLIPCTRLSKPQRNPLMLLSVTPRTNPLNNTSRTSALPSPSRSCRNKISGGNRGGETEPFGEDNAAVGPAIAVRVFEQSDHAARPAVGPKSIRIIAHLDDEHPAFAIEGEGDGI